MPCIQSTGRTLRVDIGIFTKFISRHAFKSKGFAEILDEFGQPVHEAFQPKQQEVKKEEVRTWRNKGSITIAPMKKTRRKIVKNLNWDQRYLSLKCCITRVLTKWWRACERNDKLIMGNRHAYILFTHVSFKKQNGELLINKRKSLLKYYSLVHMLLVRLSI